jgi:hypothetical protein
MSTRTINLGNDVELIIDEPSSLSSSERPLLLTSAIVQALSGSTSLSPSIHSGYLPISIGSTVYRIYYQLRVKRAMNALSAYSEAIIYIQQNPHLYDRRLTLKAVEVLQECCKEYLK